MSEIATYTMIASIAILATWTTMSRRMAGFRAELEARKREIAEGQKDLQSVEANAKNLGQQLSSLQERYMEATGDAKRLAGQLDAERAASEREFARIRETKDSMKESFVSASQQALKANTDSFLSLAESKFGELRRSATTELEHRERAITGVVKPIKEKLQNVDALLQELRIERARNHARIREQLERMATDNHQLRAETTSLVKALRAPQGRGQWGEMQLRRVVELAGMMEHCDFDLQRTITTDDGRLRPDLIVNLPGDKLVVVDSKSPLDAFLDAIATESDDQSREEALDRHARQVRSHVNKLASKEYAQQFSETPDFVVMFLPGEAFFAAALQRDPSLVEYAITNGVIPSSPTTLITLLKAVSYGWQQEKLASSAEELRTLGLELHDRIAKMADHFAAMRKALHSAVESYNRTVGSLEKRLLPTARKFKALGIVTRNQIPELTSVDVTPTIPVPVEITAERPVGDDQKAA